MTFDDDQASLTLSFYSLGEDEPFLNRLTSWFTQGNLIHVELGFKDGCACSVWSGENVYLKNRQFRNQAYKFVTLKVTPQQAFAVRKFAQKQVGKPFNKSGFYRALLPWPFYRTTDEKQWFCSELIARCLQHANILEHLNPARTSPELVYKEIRHHPLAFVNSNEFKDTTQINMFSALHSTKNGPKYQQLSTFEFD